MYSSQSVLSVLTGGSKGRDLDIMQQTASEYDAEISEIDPAPTAQPVYDRALLWGTVNWLPAVGLPVLLIPSNPLQFAVAHSLVRFVLIGYALLFVVLYLVNERREDAMAAMIRKRVSDVDTACVVLGEAHHAGVGNRLADTVDRCSQSVSSNFESINSSYISLAWLSKVRFCLNTFSNPISSIVSAISEYSSEIVYFSFLMTLSSKVL